MNFSLEVISTNGTSVIYPLEDWGHWLDVIVDGDAKKFPKEIWLCEDEEIEQVGCSLTADRLLIWDHWTGWKHGAD